MMCHSGSGQEGELGASSLGNHHHVRRVHRTSSKRLKELLSGNGGFVAGRQRSVSSYLKGGGPRREFPFQGSGERNYFGLPFVG